MRGDVKIALTTLVLALAVVAAGCGGTGQAASVESGLETGPRVGLLAPDFTLRDLAGKPLSLKDLRGQAVLVNFWATWCAPCRLEMPEIQAVYEKYKGQGFTVVAVDIRADAGPEAVRAFVAELGLTFPVVLDENGRAETSYKVRGYPTSVFIDRQGIIQYIQVGPMTQGFIEQRLAEIL